MENRLQRRHPMVQVILDNWFYLALILLMWQLPNLLGDYFGQELQPRRPQGNQVVFWMGILAQLYILAILAMSYNLVFGFSGILSFGHALYFGVAVYVVVILTDGFNYAITSSIAAALLTAVLLGLFTALAVFRIKGVYFAMFTLALAQIFHDLVRVNLFKTLTQGDDGRTLDNLPDWLNPIGNRLQFYYICMAAAIFTFFFIRRLMNSPTGKVILAVRDNEQRAQTMGYNTVLYKSLVIVLAGFFGALAGILHAIFTRQAEPTVLGVSRTTDPLFMTIIGGTGTHPGPALGAFVLHMGEQFFRKPDLQVDLNFILFHLRGEVNTVEVWRMILGVVFVAIVLFVPYGLVGQANKQWIELRQWGRRFFYNPLIRRNPALAARMEALTGESPGVAQYIAAQSAEASLMDWARANPARALTGIVISLTLLGSLLTWEIDGGIPLLLLYSLFAVPAYAAWWLRGNYQNIFDRSRDFFGQFIKL